MSVETWGLMPKSGVDLQTVDEAIAAAIAAHEADATAHLGTGESIDEHRKEGVIDHPAGSVLADKRTMTELSIDHDFSNISAWHTVGVVSNDDWPGVNLYVEWGGVNTSTIYLTPQIPSPFDSYDFDSTMQVLCKFFEDSSRINGQISMGSYGYKITSGVLRAYIKNGSSFVYSESIAIDLTGTHLYRMQLNVTEGVATFFIDGEQVASLNVPPNSPDTDDGPLISVTITGNTDGNVWVADLHFSRAII